MSVTEAEKFFGDGEARIPAAHAILDRLADVGLGYLSLGQPLTTLSAGERQRVKLATQMAEKGGVYVLDEPTTGLHLADVERLLGLIDRLVDSGKSVIVIEHHQAVMAHADWIIDLGPGAGRDGGRVVFEGAPAEIVADRIHPHRGAPRRVHRQVTEASVVSCPIIHVMSSQNDVCLSTYRDRHPKTSHVGRRNRDRPWARVRGEPELSSQRGPPACSGRSRRWRCFRERRLERLGKPCGLAAGCRRSLRTLRPTPLPI